MTTSESRLEYLYRQYTAKTCTQEEMEEFFTYVRDPAYRQRLETLTDSQLEAMDMPAGVPVVDWEHMYRQVMSSQTQARPKKKAPLFTLARSAAAACILLAAIGAWLYVSRRQPAMAPSPVAEIVVAPGYNKAVLTLGDGATIVLDSAHTGLLAKQGDVVVVNAGDGGLAYSGQGNATDKTLYNTLTTPRGGQYQLTLPDGTKAWLNAASSLTYPTAFRGNERMVQLTGEAYFEVVHNQRQPFRVKTSHYTVEDIGTHFNINAYSDEPEHVTTLLEGAVKIGQHSLKRGQKASAADSAHITVATGDVIQAVAWKNGFFDFDDASLQTVMRQLARWYNVDVRYEGNSRQRQFTGMIGRGLTLGQVLRGLSTEGVHYRMEDSHHLIITP